MVPMIIALVVIAVISFFCLWFRAFATFNLILIGTAMLIAHHYSGEDLWLGFGASMLIGGLVILFITSLQVHGSAKFPHMLHVFLYGFFMFLRLFCICLIITLPLVGMIGAICRSYREICLADGSRVWVNDSNEDAAGNRYERIRR